MLDFDLARPTSLREAIDLLDTDDPAVRPISGGTALMLMMKSGVFNPTLLVDLSEIESEHAAINVEGAGGLRIGGLASLSALEKSVDAARIAPVIGRSMKRLANVRVRNAARVGGCLAHGDPHMDLPPILSSLRGEVIATGPAGERNIPVEQLFAGYYETVLGQGEIITAVRLPSQVGWRTVYRKTTVRTHDDWPTLGVAVSLRLDGDLVAESRIVVSAATEKLTRLVELEEMITGQRLDETHMRRLGDQAARIVDTLDDAQGSAAYKKVIVGVELRRALAAALVEDVIA